MKKKILLSALLLFATAASLFAEGFDFSSRRQVRCEGFDMRLGWSFGTSYYFDCPSVSDITFGAQLNPYLMVGGGITWISLTDYYYRYDYLPIFANARIYCLDTYWSPYFDIKLGYDLYSYYGYYSPLYLAFGAGASFRHFDFGLGVATVDESDLFFTFGCSYNFRISNKLE